MNIKRSLPQSGGAYERQLDPKTQTRDPVLVVEPTLAPIGKTAQAELDAAKAAAEANAGVAVSAQPVASAHAPSANTGNNNSPTAQRSKTRGDASIDSNQATE